MEKQYGTSNGHSKWTHPIYCNTTGQASRLKGWMQRFNGVATRYLDSYLGWRRFYEKHKENACNQKPWLIEAMGAVPG